VRLFVAVTPPAGVLDGLDAAVTAARAGRGDRRDLRWTGPEDRHVTLAFLGEVPGSAAERLTPGLGQAAAGAEPFPLALAGAGAFPAPVRARVLWCGLGGDRSALAALAAAVAAAATRAGVAPPDAGRPFRPHLTLAYARPPADVRDLVTALGPYEGPSWLVDRIQLIESRPGRRPRYTTVGRWPLNGDTLNR
jgi:2'-5' RNA ligase